MKTGEVIKEIRINKGIKSVDLYASILSKQAAIKFENGYSDTTVSKFFVLIDRLNISLEEFEEFYIQHTTDFYFTNKYIKMFYQKDIAGLKKLIDEAELSYEFSKNKKYKHYASVVQVLLDYLNGDLPCSSSLKILKDHLIICENWGYYEIILFTNSIIFLPGEFIDNVYRKVKKIMMSIGVIRYRNETALMLFNILEKKILEKDLDKLLFYLTEIQTIKNNVLDNVYIQIMIKFFTLLINAILNKIFNIDQEINKIIDFFIFIELNSKAEQCKDFFVKVKKLYEFT